MEEPCILSAFKQEEFCYNSKKWENYLGFKIYVT